MLRSLRAGDDCEQALARANALVGIWRFGLFTHTAPALPIESGHRIRDRAARLRIVAGASASVWQQCGGYLPDVNRDGLSQRIEAPQLDAHYIGLCARLSRRSQRRGRTAPGAAQVKRSCVFSRAQIQTEEFVTRLPCPEHLGSIKRSAF